MNVNNSTFLIVLIATTLTTFFLRAAPIVIPRKWLASPLLQALNRYLPLCVMVALVLTTFTKFESPIFVPATAQVLALIVVLMSYIRFKNVLLSMILGVSSLNGFLFLFDRM